MKEEEIKEAIEKRVNAPKSPNYSSWYIGITDDLKRRKEEHESEGKNTKYWRDWEADSEAIARRIEEYFQGKGMDGAGGGGDNPNYVYIF